MLSEPVTRAAILTPPGRGAVAVIAVRGDDATALVDSLFHAGGGLPLAMSPLGRIRFGRWERDSGEELIAVRRDEQTVEVHCHGGVAAAKAILDSLASRDCQVVDPGSWLEWFKPDRIERESILALTQARTFRTAEILWRQKSGALRSAVRQIQADLRDNHLAAAIDRLQRLLDCSRVGLHLTEPFRVVLAGPPNAGKSSLINGLSGYERSIVFDQPGTTRDVVTAYTAVDGWPVELADTAGLRAAIDPLEHAGIARAGEQMSRADLIVLVFDASKSWTADDARLAAQWPESLVLHHKCDLPCVDGELRPPGISTSTLTRAGIDELLVAMATRLVANPPEVGEAVPFTRRQVEIVREALDLLRSLPSSSTASIACLEQM